MLWKRRLLNLGISILLALAFLAIACDIGGAPTAPECIITRADGTVTRFVGTCFLCTSDTVGDCDSERPTGPY